MFSLSTKEGHFLGLLQGGGFAMYPLLACSIVIWCIIFERVWNFYRLGHGLREFYLEALQSLLAGDRDAVRRLCQRYPYLPTSILVGVAIERLSSKDQRLKEKWMDAIDRRRQLLNHQLKQNLWLLGTIGSASPFIGLFGTVVGILRSFQEMAKTGSGGFAVVASGISESLIATAAGIVVAVVAVMAYNAFLTRWHSLVLTIRVQTEELSEHLWNCSEGPPRGVGVGTEAHLQR